MAVSASDQLAWIRRFKPILFILCLLPVVLLVFNASTGNLSADPIEDITYTTGEWSLRFLLITLCVTPLRHITGWYTLIRVRRMLGLFAFFYVCLHFLTYIVLEQYFAWPEIVEDILTRNYILVGFLGFVLLIPLAVTSTNKMVKRLGGKRWLQLHRLIYVATVAGILHFLWLVKSDVTEPIIHAIILTLLLAYRAFQQRRESNTQSRIQAKKAQATA